jgi:hypothetical protein
MTPTVIVECGGKELPIAKVVFSATTPDSGVNGLNAVAVVSPALEIAESYEEYSAQRNLLGAGREAAP